MRLPWVTPSVQPELKEAIQLAEKQHRETMEGLKKQYQATTPSSPVKVDLGPLERIIVFDEANGGVTWIAALPRRVIMEHVNITARRLQQRRRLRNMALWGFIGILVGTPLGSIGGFVLLALGKVLFSPVATLLLCLFAGVLWGLIPGLVFGWRRQGPPYWFVRRNGESVIPVEYEIFDQKRFHGHVIVNRNEKGGVSITVPPGVKAQSASFMFHACRSNDWKGLWKGGASRWASLRTISIVVLAVSVLIIMFIVGWTSIQSGGTPPPEMMGGANG